MSIVHAGKARVDHFRGRPFYVEPLGPLEQPDSHPPQQQKQPRKPKDVDVLNVLRSLAGFLPQAIAQLEAEQDDTRVPISKDVFLKLLARVGPGVSIRGMVERAVLEWLDEKGNDPA